MSISLCVVGHLMLPLLRHGREPWVGGAEVQMFHLAAALRAHDVRSTFLVCGAAPADRGHLDTPYGPAEVLFPRRSQKSLRDKWREKHALWRAVRRSTADVVYQRAVWDADIASWAARRADIPYVYALASDRDALALPFLSRRRAVIRWASAIVAQTESQREAVHRVGRDAVCIPSGFPLPPPPTVERDTILWAGTLRALKRPQVLLDLAEALPEESFVLCGGGGEDPQIANAVAARAATLANVRHDGFVPYHEMATRFERARILLNTSVYEGFPNTFVLAWLHGALVLSLGVDPDGLLSRGGLGAVARDAADLARLVRRARQEPAWVEDTTARARAHAERHHDIEVVARAYESLFTTLPRRG